MKLHLFLGTMSVCLLGCIQGAQAAPLATSYSIDSMGLTDGVHLSNTVSFLNEAGQVVGGASRFTFNPTVYLGNSAWLYNGASTVNIGLTGVEHTRNDGFQLNNASFLSGAGKVGGQANRYNGGGADLGQTAWLYNGTSTVNIGLTGAEHTRDDGYRTSAANRYNEAGQAAGIAERYNGTAASTGTSAWLYNGTSTVNIGLIGAEHTRNDGYRASFVDALNEAGQVAGIARRYSGGTDLGQTAWLYNGTSTANIGLTGIEHTRNDGLQVNNIKRFNETGQVAGTANRYNGSGSAILGQTAWLYDGVSTVDIGLTGTDYTRTDGRRYSNVKYLNEAGQAAGTANRFSGGNSLGQSAWLYNGTSTLDISLTGGEHTRSDGYRSGDVQFLNIAGDVVGTAERYSNTGANLGQSAWQYNGTGTVNIGLTGVEHTRSDGYRSSQASALNEAGQVAGTAERYDGGGTNLGQSVWLHNGTGTVNAGLTGAGYTRTDGYQLNSIISLNEIGQVAGQASRYDGYNSLGQSAWLYDLTLDQTFSLDLSFRSDGYAFSRVNYLGDDGLLLGDYRLYDTDDTFLGFRAFAFTLDDGAFDLGALVEGGLGVAGWDSLGDTFAANSLGQIVGSGSLTGGLGSVGYILTPVSAVPVPAAVWLFGSGLFSLIVVAKRNKSVPLFA